MKQLYFVVFLFICIRFSATSQGTSLQPNKITPPSPTAAALGKYGEIPVQLHTGVPTIEIPLYTIATPKLSVPIGISYHASGIKVEEIASIVGLGWTLNAGGVITRSVVGQADEDTDGFLSPSVQTKMQNYKNQTMSLSEREQFEVEVADGTIDTEPDLFYYNFLGRSGKMMYSNSGEMVLIDHQNIRIEKTTAGFVLTDESGVKYTFETSESTDVLVNCGGSQTPNGSNTTAWYLSKITPLVGREILFNYASTPTSVYSGKSETDALPNLYNPYGCSSNAPSTQVCRTRINGYYQRLTQIVFENGTVDFGYGSRLDEGGMFKLENLTVKNTSNEVIKSYAFTYGYSTPNLRLFLDQLAETTSSLHPPIHQFTYNNRNNLPAVGSFTQDYWGYYNSNLQNSLIPFVAVPSNYQQRSVWANREADATKTTTGLLSRITYPTKGFTEFEFERHDYGYWFVSSINENGNNYKIAGGARIKRIKNYSVTGTVSNERWYEYRESIDPTRSSGMLVQKPVYGYASSTTNVQLAAGTTTTCNKYVLSSSSHSHLGASNGNHVTYKEVTEYYAADKQTRGKTVHTFTSHFDYPDSPEQTELPFAPSVSKEVFRGKPLLKTDYEYLSGNFVAKQWNSSGYTATLLSTIEGLKIRFSHRITYDFNGLSTKQLDSIKVANPSIYSSSTGQYGVAEYAFYQQPIMWMYSHQNITNQSESSGTVSTTSYFTYNPTHLQLSELRTQRSNSTQEKVVNFTYPRDYSILSGVTLSSESEAIRQLQLKHSDNSIIEERQYEKKGGVNYLTSSSLTTYLSSGNGLVAKVYRYEPSSSLLGWNSSYITNSGVFQRDGRLRELYAYERYDAYGNIQQVRLKSGLVRSYVWGYGSKYPIIEGVGIDYQSLENVNGNLTNLSNETDINNATNSLRAFYPHAHFQSYVHSPLKGLVSSYLPNNQKTTYNYDGFHRLSSIKDNTNAVTNKFSYAYATSTTVVVPSNLAWDGSRNSCSNTDGIHSVLSVYVTGIGTGASVEFSTDGSNWFAANVGIDGYQVSVPYQANSSQYFAARPSDNPINGVISGWLSKCAFSGGVAPPTVVISSSSLCNVTLSASGCGGTVTWSNGSTGNSLNVSTTTTTAYTATCTVGSTTSSPSTALTIPVLPSGWNSVDIGNPTAGCTQVINGNLTLQSNGSIGQPNPDNIHYVYRSMTGDFTAILKINALSADDGDRAGFMIRSDLGALSTDFTLFQDGNSYVGTFHRLGQGEANTFGSFQQASLNATWLKLVKTGNNITYYFSTNTNPEANNGWSTGFTIVNGTNPQPINLGSSYLLGFATWGNATQATFSNITINGQTF
jgi:YD repeat-containing protein